MINSTPAPDRTPSPQLPGAAQSKRPASGVAGDTFTAQQQGALRNVIDSQPELRAEVVARGRALAADASYPSQETLRSIAGQIIKAEDLTKE